MLTGLAREPVTHFESALGRWWLTEPPNNKLYRTTEPAILQLMVKIVDADSPQKRPVQVLLLQP